MPQRVLRVNPIESEGRGVFTDVGRQLESQNALIVNSKLLHWQPVSGLPHVHMRLRFVVPSAANDFPKIFVFPSHSK